MIMFSHQWIIFLLQRNSWYDRHQGNPWKYYEQLMDQIIKRHPEYKEDFENGMNNNHENVLNEE